MIASDWDRLRTLSITIEAVATRVLERQVSPEFTRSTTVVELSGDGFVGLGEDVTYDGAEHAPVRFPSPRLAGTWTLATLSAHLDAFDLFPASEPAQEAYRGYRRWAFESAALDLALQQAGLSLADAVDRTPAPVRFCVSTRATSLAPLLELYPDTQFKLDASPEWDATFIADLAKLNAVHVVDLKGAYRGTVVDLAPDPELYVRVAEGLPSVWIEDPGLTPETDAALAPYRDRFTWDAPIHSYADVEALPYAPRCLNSKPSRFGTLERLFTFYAQCEAAGIALYGGGQFELGPGRGQIQLLASLYHPDGPNDTSPAGYNAPEPVVGLETSPLEPHPAATGFRRVVPAAALAA
jgi:hypothetical protein